VIVKKETKVVNGLVELYIPQLKDTTAFINSFATQSNISQLGYDQQFINSLYEMLDNTLYEMDLVVNDETLEKLYQQFRANFTGATMYFIDPSYGFKCLLRQDPKDDVIFTAIEVMNTVYRNINLDLIER
jgi:hypothetical protein